MTELTQDVLEQILQSAREDTPVGYAQFYELIHNRPLPAHAYAWIEHIYAARAAGDDCGLEAFRGSTKTTTVMTFVAFQIGLRPHLEWALFQASDDSSKENMGFIADIISNNPAWKAIFPHVVPDPSQSWGDKGYEVKRTDMDYGEWRRLRTKDPCFVGYGYKSGIIGKHPRGGIVVDDIHDETNTSSERELQRVKRTYSGTIVPLANPTEPGGPTTFVLIVGTPWVKHDVLMTAKASGQYRWMATPACKPDYSELAWPEFFTKQLLEKVKSKDLTEGKTEFPRMYLLDLEQSAQRLIVFQDYPEHLVNWAWPHGGGCDPAGVADPTKRDDKHSHFAHSYIAKTPENMAVVTGGVLEQCGLGEAIDHLDKAQKLFPSWLHTVVEGDGAGDATFQAAVLLKPHLRIVMEKTKSKSKATRIVNGVVPWTRLGRVRLSTADTPFLNAARKFAAEYPNVGEKDPGWDAWDSIYWGLRVMPDVLTMPDEQYDLPSVHGRVREPNPFNSLGERT